jgi:hypothetical protein
MDAAAVRSDPDVFVIQDPEDRKRDDGSGEAGRTMDRRIRVQGRVRTSVIAAVGIETKNLPEKTLAKAQDGQLRPENQNLGLESRPRFKRRCNKTEDEAHGVDHLLPV